jgi:hypothetical protein
MTVDQDYLNNYFANVWQGSAKNFKETGLSLSEKIKPDEWVLDVGCGSNPFKGLIPNLVGIDPANEQADYKVTIEDFKSDRLFDVALCLGSINFGNVTDISKQIESLITHLKPNARIYWRCNPGLQDHGNEECKKINFFPWSFEWHRQLSMHYGFQIKELAWETNKKRIYAEWLRI